MRRYIKILIKAKARNNYSFMNIRLNEMIIVITEDES